MFFVFVFVFSPDVFWELKISEKFWYQAQGKMGGKRNHHNLKRLKLPSCPFYRGTGWWTLADVDTTNRQRFESQALWWWMASLPWLEGWAARSFRPGLSAAVCQDAFSGLAQLPTFSSFFPWQLTSKSWLHFSPLELPSLPSSWSSFPSLRCTVGCSVSSSLLPPYS